MKLNLCCGTNLFPGWINIDKTDVEADYIRHLRDAPPGFVWPPDQQRVADAVLAGNLEFVRHDVRRGLPYADGSVDAIYVGQAIEHFNRRTEVPAFLRECLRVLRSGGRIRLTTPDLNALIDADDNYQFCGRFRAEQPAFFADALPEDQFAYLIFGASGPNCTAENYEGHFHCYTWRSLAELLREIGFDVRPSIEPSGMTDTTDKGMSHSFAIEAVKP